jgi:hypothetical protein
MDEKEAAAYIKLQENVQELIVSSVYGELLANPHGMLANHIKMLLQQTIKDEMKQYRVVRMGQTATY